MENQDKVSGKLKSIEDGKALFTSSYADLTVPLDRIEEINMSSEGADQAKRNAGDIRAFFADRGSITMQLESWDSKQATATSPNFGKATFSSDAFLRLQFNLNRQPSRWRGGRWLGKTPNEVTTPSPPLVTASSNLDFRSIVILRSPPTASFFSPLVSWW